MKVVLAAVLLSGVLPVKAEAPARIARFSGDRAAAISYTFDDGIRDQYTLAVPMLDEVGFKGTFFVIPNSVVATVEEAEKKKDAKRAWGSITWDELRKMAAAGHEIGSHTWSHTGLTKQTPEEASSRIYVEKLGPAKAQTIASRSDDTTHFNEEGARAMADLVAKDLNAAAPGLGALLKTP